jgi:signal transduction histidine kinase
MLLEGDAGRISKKQKDFLQEVYTANKRMVALVGALLNVSRIELGTFTIVPKPTDIAVLVQDVLKMLKPEIEMRAIKLEERYGDIPTMNVDPQLMQIVFQNLISNAVKYTPNGGTVGVDISRSGWGENIKKEERDQLCIHIRDTGYGIPKNQQSKIFTKLFRADNIKSKVTDGNGLGLYIVKSIVSHSGGTISFESQEDKGTTFCVTLPFSGMRKKMGTKKLGI